MGTSSIFYGQKDRNPLLPEDYESPKDAHEMSQKDNKTSYEDQETSPKNALATIEVVKWKTVKSDMSKYLKSNGMYGSPRHIARQYVKASGGARKMSSRAFSGKKAGGNLGNFFNSIVTKGVELTFKELGIQYIGKPVEEVFSKLVDAIAPNSNTKEDIIAKEAAQMALAMLYDYIELNDIDIECIGKVPAEFMNEVLKEYTEAYIWITMMRDLTSRLEMYMDNADDAYSKECEFKDMIKAIVDVEFKKQGYIIDNKISTTMNKLYENCLEILEAII